MNTAYDLTVKERILLNLMAHEHANGDEFATVDEVSQTGMAELCGVSRPHVSTACKELVKEGFAVLLLRHVAGHDAKISTYRLTDKGHSKAASIKRVFPSLEIGQILERPGYREVRRRDRANEVKDLRTEMGNLTGRMVKIERRLSLLEGDGL